MAHIEILLERGNQNARSEPHPVRLVIPTVVSRIIAEVADANGITVRQLLAEAACWRARREAIQRVRREVRTATYAAIARWFGRHETTIRNALGTWRQADRTTGRPNAAALNRAKTHCPQGHPYSGDNLYVHPDGRHRACRTCRSAKS